MSVDLTDREFAKLKDHLQSNCGIDVPPEKRYLFVTRLSDWMGTVGLSSFSDLLDRLTGPMGATLEPQLVEAMTTNETSFFRDDHPFQTFTQTILPDLADRRARESRFVPPRVRIWSAGCSTGEEPYSLAMSVLDWFSTQSSYAPGSVTILASDISRDAMAHARRGVYPERQIERDLSARQRTVYFRKTKDGYLVNPEPRSMVFFAEVNLSKDIRHLGYFDVIFCRNVIIYFSLKLKRKILDSIYRMLNPGGVLVLGASESIYQLSDRFRTVHSGPTLYHIRDEEHDLEDRGPNGN